MAHLEGGIITAEEARTIATRIVEEGRTELELKDRYSQGLKEIEKAANNGSYGVALKVGASDRVEFTELVTDQGFRVFQNSTTPEGGQPVSIFSEDQTLENIEINWSTFEFTQTATTLQRPDFIELTVTVSGYPLSRPLYYTLTGTLTATDFVNNQDEGELTFALDGTAAILIQVDLGGSRVGKTVQALVFYDENRETLLHAFDEITVVV